MSARPIYPALRLAAVVLGGLHLLWATTAIAGPNSGAIPKVLCAHNSSGILSLRRKCKSSETRISTRAELTGPNGEAGTDGSLRIFGDGSAGAVVFSSSSTLQATNLQYTDVTVSAGVTLTVPSGTVIRCTGTFSNSGTIAVESGPPLATVSGLEVGDGGTATSPAMRAVAQGISRTAAQHAEYGPNSVVLFGGTRGVGLSELQARQLRYPGVIAGGNGSTGVNGAGGSGGGSLVVLCQTAIVNAVSGLITAPGRDGVNGGGGGAGGVVILASPGSISNSGTISAVGGTGGASRSISGAGGGGGGGIVHLVSPSISAGTLLVSGGAVGSTSVAVTATLRSGGGAGGGSGGEGGDGASVAADNSQSGESGGLEGWALQSQQDPTSLF